MEWHFSPEAHPLHIGSLKCTGSPPGLGDFELLFRLILFIFLSSGLCTRVGALSCLHRDNLGHQPYCPSNVRDG